MTALCSLSKARLAALFGGLCSFAVFVLAWLPVPPAVLSAVAGLTLLSAALAFWHLGRVAGWIGRVRQTVEAVAAGDFEHRLVRLDQGGELGGMLRGVNRLIDVTDAFVREAGSTMEAVEQGRYYRLIRPGGLSGHFLQTAERINTATASISGRVRHFAELTDGFEEKVGRVVEAVAGSAGELQSTADHLTGLAAAATRQSTSAAAATEQASSNVQAVANSTGELAASIAEIARQVAEAESATTAAGRKAEAANKLVGALNAAADEIGSVVSLISEISDQTNLLALNATIEAARAGEAGKGFAVVAGEVKNLAGQTGQATEQIQTQVAAIRSATTEAVAAIEAIVGSIAEVSGMSGSIAAAVDQQTSATDAITRNVQEASSGTEEVARSTEQVSASAGETDRASRDVAAAAAELARQAEHLRGDVDHYLQAARVA